MTRKRQESTLAKKFRPMLSVHRHGTALPLEAIFALAAGYSVIERNWSQALIPVLVLVASPLPVLIERRARAAIPSGLHFFYVAFLFAGPFAGSHLHLYGAWVPWDSVVHTASGVLVGYGVIYASGFIGRRYLVALPTWLEVAVVLMTGGFVAAFWEILEFTSDHLLGTSAQNGSLVDTMTDIICGTFGSAAVAILLLVHRMLTKVPSVASTLRASDELPSLREET